MKLELLDAYNIRARLSASIILLAPIAITVFVCFDEIHNIATSAVIIGLFLAFTNYVPILLRRLCGSKQYFVNCAVEFLMPNDNTIDAISKHRYYRYLASRDSSFEMFLEPTTSDEFRKCCESAVSYLRHHTRDNHLVQEENINYGFCKNLLSSKIAGIIICIMLCAMVAICASMKYDLLIDIPTTYYFVFVTNIAMLIFWCFGITKQTLENTARSYARTLIIAIDTLE